MALFISYIIYVEYLLNDYRVTLCFPRKTFEFHTVYKYISNNTTIMTPPSHGYIILLHPSYRPIIVKIFMRLRRASVF